MPHLNDTALNRPKRKRFSFGIWLPIALALLITGGFLTKNFLAFRQKMEDAWKYHYPASKLSEIRSCEIAYFAEWNSYVANQPPVTPPGVSHTQWLSQTRFSIIGYAFYDSEDIYLTPDYNCSFSLEGSDFPTQAEGFTSRAVCDQNFNGRPEIYFITDKPADLSRSGEILR